MLTLTVGYINIIIHMNMNEAERFHNFYWNIFGYLVPKTEVTFFCQFLTLFILIIFSLVSLTIGENTNFWGSILCSSVGILMPNPNINIQKKDNSFDAVDGRMNTKYRNEPHIEQS